MRALLRSAVEFTLAGTCESTSIATQAYTALIQLLDSNINAVPSRNALVRHRTSVISVVLTVATDTVDLDYTLAHVAKPTVTKVLYRYEAMSTIVLLAAGHTSALSLPNLLNSS